MIKDIVFVLMLSMVGSVVASEFTILSTMDIRRSPTSAPLVHRTNVNTTAPKLVRFTFYTGDLWINNPDAHLYMLTDGYILPGITPGNLVGRGIILGHTPNCNGSGFEKFGTNNGYSNGCITMSFRPDSFYHVTVYTTPEKVDLSIIGPDTYFRTTLAFTGTFLSNDTIMGVAGDKNTATFGIFNLHQAIAN